MIEIKGITKSYTNNLKAVDNLSITIEKGDIYGFIGANGSGKTTTLKAIVGIHDIDQGEIIINGLPLLNNKVLSKSIMAYIPDNPDIYENITGKQYINFVADMYGVNMETRQNLSEKYSELFEMESHLDEQISTYSHGMKQRIVLIAALVHEPKIIIMDEPFVGLDPKASFVLKKLMKEIVDQGGAIFFSTHVLEVAEKLCNKIAIIKGGKLIASGITKDVTKNKSLESVFMDVQNHE